MPVILVYAGLIVGAIGLISILIPLRFLFVSSRGVAVIVALCGAIFFFVGMALPVRITHHTARTTGLDEYFPAYQSNEVHSARIHATPARVFEAIKSVTPIEIRFFAFLNRLRNPRAAGDPRRHQLLEKPMCDIMHRAGFVTLKEEDHHELVMGVVGRFWGPASPGKTRVLKVKGSPTVGSSARITTPGDFESFIEPGYAKAAINFVVEDEGNGWCRLNTETRALGTDPRSRTDFERYWRIIAPGSAVIRRSWLAAIRKRAEAPADTSGAPGARPS